MLKRIIFVLTVLIIFKSTGFAQQNGQPSGEVEKLSLIYYNLEYNTIAYDDLKKKWIINDPVFVRDVYSRFIVNNALRIDGQPVTREILKQKSQQIFEGDVVIDVRKRYYDDEIEYFSFLPVSEIDKQEPDYLFDPVNDGFFLQQVIGNTLYTKIQEQSYFFSDITKESFYAKQGYYFDVYLNALEPQIMFWNTTSDFRNKYLLSYVGRWGNDEIFLPGHYLGEYFVGANITYHDVLSEDPLDYTYSVSLGVGFPSNIPFASTTAPSPLRKSSQTLYYYLSGNPFLYIFGWDDWYWDIEGMFSFGEYDPQDFELETATDAYSVRNFLVSKIRVRKVLDLYNFGDLDIAFGVSTHDRHHYTVDPSRKELIDLAPEEEFFDKFVHTFFVEYIVSKGGGLLQYEITPTFGYNVNGIGFFGAKAKFMLSSSFGFDIRYYGSFGYEETDVPYRDDSYLVFSPILHINY